MLFSLIIPLYNKENYIKETINSVLCQSFSDFELIVVDDGSKDNSVSVVKSINDERIQLYQKENAGVSIARNYGLNLAKGDFIAFLDADDLWHKDFLLNMSNLIKKYPEEKFFSTAQILDRNGVQEKITHKEEKGEDYIIEDYCKERTFCRVNLCAVGSVCIEKNLLQKVKGFCSGIKYGEDLDLWLRLACETRLVFSNKLYFTYNIGVPNNTANSYRKREFVFPYWNWYKYKYFKKSSLYLFTTREILSMLKDAISARHFADAFFYLRKIRLW
ncbi:MAG: glycosyltransferase family 2 protein [Bacteroidales bacterium]|nr:glycosyltransferase family 2 protein [Bacteroidales bacterium]